MPTAITARSVVETQLPSPLPEQLDMGEWDRLRSEFLRGENFDYLNPHGFARETEDLHRYMADHEIDRDWVLAPALADYLASGKEHWRKHVLGFAMGILQEGLHDRAITRDLDWGVPIPVEGFENKRIYVRGEIDIPGKLQHPEDVREDVRGRHRPGRLQRGLRAVR